VDNISLSTSVEDFNPDALHAYIIAKKYGRLYLSNDEYRACRQKADQDLYSVLAFNILKSRGHSYWQYQKKALHIVGECINWKRLVLMQILRALRWMGNPWSTVESIYRHWIGRSA
jgi:hypothetical protein